MMQNEARLQLPISAKKFVRALFIANLIMFCINLVGIYFKMYRKDDKFWSNAVYFFFDSSSETSVQTVYSTLLLFTATAILLVIGIMLDPKDPTRKYWFVLGFTFCFLALDESLTIHEQFNKLRPVVDDQTGYLYFSWVIPYTILVVVAGLFFFRFLILLPPFIRNLFIISGIIYVGAAIGFELMEGFIHFNYGKGTDGGILLPPIEEFCEMCGITLFVFAAMRHLTSFRKEIELSFK